ncbi:MAG: hypothetical protein J3Q66DRAFT_339636 [Benniella sp.]|nr:MAG: hypothetical protein J3Q66DRAFT_339636 [Benniella sp.]
MAFTHQHPHQQRPPTLSFRSFHEKHFSQSQRQAFFSNVSHPWFPAPTQTFQQTGEANDQELDPEDEELYEDTYEPEEEDDEADMIPPQLTKEAIEIFEFSRRFRQEKERAAQLEKARIKRRKTKRQKLTKLGFAFDEGDSGTEDGNEAEGNGENGVAELREDVRLSEDDEGDGYEVGDGDEGEDEDGENSDYEISRMEPPATDVSFMNQGTRRNDKTRQRLYGQVSNANQSTPSAEGIRTIEILEGILNQTYLDSLGPQVFNPEATELDQEANDVKGQRRRRRKEYQPESRTSQVVYWPGLPLRC